MNVFHKVTLQSLRKNKTRTIVTIIGIILSAAMICAVTTFVSSVQNFALQYAIYTEGDWHGAIYDATFADLQAIDSSDKVADSTYGQVYGYAKVGSTNEYKPYLYVIGGEKSGYFDSMPVHLISGRIPQNGSEILLPEHLSSNGGVTWKEGDRITLQIGRRTLDGFTMGQDNPCYTYDPESRDEVLNDEVIDNTIERTYTVVGIYERPSFEPRTAPGYTAITVEDPTWQNPTEIHVYFNMKDPGEIYNFMVDMGFAQTYSYAFNDDVLLYYGVSYFDSFRTMLYSLAAIVIGLIMFGSVSLIYNAFSISVSERTKQFGLLSSVGATKAQLRRMVLFEALAVSAIGIPLGILAGIGGIGITLLVIGNKFSSLIGGAEIPMRICVSWQSVVIAALVALITVLISAWIPSARATKVTAVEAIRQNMDVKNTKPVKTSKLTYKLFGLPGVLASQYYSRIRKKYRATVISLFMSVVLFVSASAFTAYLTETTAVGFNTAGYDLNVSLPGDQFVSITPDQLLYRMKCANAVTDAAYSQEWYSGIRLQTDCMTEEGVAFLDRNKGQVGDPSVRNAHAYITFVDDDAFKALLWKYDLSEEKFLDPKNPLGIAVDKTIMFDVNAERYETTILFQKKAFSLQLQREKEIPGYYWAGEIIDQMGKELVIYRKNNGSGSEDEDVMFLTPQEAYTYFDHNVGHVIYETPFFARQSTGVRLIYPISLAERVIPEVKATEDRYNYMICSKEHGQSYTALRRVLSDNGFAREQLHNVAEIEESKRNTVTIIQVFAFGFIALISLIAATNVFNTISTNIGLRRREFAMLRSVGMSQKGFNRMMNYECLLYGSKALLYGLPVSCGVTYLIYLAISDGFDTTFRLPWAAMGIATLSVFLVVFVTMMYAMSKLKKEDPIQVLKNENL